jgi:hypothetical protein
MSKQNIRKAVSVKLLKDLDRAQRNTVADAARKVLSTKEASQCLVLDRKAVTALTLGMEAGIGRKLTTYERKKYRAEVKSFFIKMSSTFPKGRYSEPFKRLLARNRLELGRNIFFLGTDFKGIKKRYHSFNESFIKETKSLKGTEYDNKKPGTQVQFDHGAEGTAVGTLGGGAGAVAVAMDSEGADFQLLKKVAGDNLEAVLAEQFKDLSSSAQSKIYNRLFDIIINWDQVVKKTGGLNAGIGLVIRPIKTKENLARSGVEKKEMDAILEAMQRTIQEVPWDTVEGSSSARQKVQASAIKRVVEPLEKIVKKSKGSSIKLDKSIKSTKLKTSSVVKEKNRKGKGVRPTGKTSLSGRLASPILAAKGATRAKKSNYNTVYMIGVINQQLPETVAKNMGSPKLNFRTGRFAGSVRVTDISITAKGHPSIGYTYQRNPYEVFESSSGSRLSSAERDPRRLIDTSIREIAAQQAIGRLFTRRV